MTKTSALLRMLAFASALVAAACGGDETKLERVHALMLEEMDPAVDGIWDAAGFVLTAEGEKSLYPTTDDGWRAVMDSADALAESARKLKTDRYAMDGSAWGEFCDGLVVAANVAKGEAEAQDEQGLFDAGGQIYQICSSCHEAYAPDMSGDPLP